MRKRKIGRRKGRGYIPKKVPAERIETTNDFVLEVMVQESPATSPKVHSYMEKDEIAGR